MSRREIFDIAFQASEDMLYFITTPTDSAISTGVVMSILGEVSSSAIFDLDSAVLITVPSNPLVRQRYTLSIERYSQIISV